MTVVHNAMKDRGKAMRRIEGTQYEWGWTVACRRKAETVFTRVGTGSYDEAVAWMNAAGYAPEPRKVLTGHYSL